MKIKDFKESFRNVKDFRQAHKAKHDLTEMLFVAVIYAIMEFLRNDGGF